MPDPATSIAGVAAVPRLALRPREAAAAIGVSDRTIDDLLRDPSFPRVRVGRAVLVPVAGLAEWLARQSDLAAPAAGAVAT